MMNRLNYNFSDSKTDTIGCQFPFISNNQNMKYRKQIINKTSFLSEPQSKG